MANLLDETQGPINDNGRDIHVIDRQLPVTITFKSTLFEIALWVTIPVLTLLYVSFMGNKLESPGMVALIGCVCGILPGVIFIFMKISARNYFQQLEQRIQAEASNIDNYLEQRVQILQNVVGLVDRAVDLDKDVMKAVAALRGGKINDANRSDVNSQLNMACGRLFPQVEAYPELKAHQAIADAMQQNSYLQREIHCCPYGIQQQGDSMEHRHFRLAYQDDCRSPSRLHDKNPVYRLCRDPRDGSQQILLIGGDDRRHL